MGWPEIRQRLLAGEPVTLRPAGQSMTPIIKSKQRILIRPVDPAEVDKGDIVLAKVNGRHYLHLVSAATVDKVQISNNHGHVNGWTQRANVYGIVRRADIG